MRARSAPRRSSDTICRCIGWHGRPCAGRFRLFCLRRSNEARMLARARARREALHATVRYCACGCSAALAASVRPRPELSQSPDPADRAVRGRRRGGRAGAPARRQAVRSGRPAGHRREPPRRRRHACRRPGREIAARRLHHPAEHQRRGHRARALQQPAVRRDQRLRAGDAACRLQPHPGGEPQIRHRLDAAFDRARPRPTRASSTTDRAASATRCISPWR